MSNTWLANSVVVFGCYIAGNFVGVIAYADDIIFISPAALGTRRLLLICDSYADEYDIVFNASKSKFLVCISDKLCQMFSGCITSLANQSKTLSHILTLSIS